MKELSLNILDIAENSVKANATLVCIDIIENNNTDKLELKITDNGDGMTSELLSKVCDPFTTTRTTRKVGLGIPLLKEAAEITNGSFEIKSEQGVGTKVYATFVKSHIDRMPIGDMAATIEVLIGSHPKIDFVYTHEVDEKKFVIDTRQMRYVLEDMPINSYEVINFVKELTNSNLAEIYR